MNICSVLKGTGGGREFLTLLSYLFRGRQVPSARHVLSLNNKWRLALTNGPLYAAAQIKGMVRGLRVGRQLCRRDPGPLLQPNLFSRRWVCWHSVHRLRML